MAKIVFLGGIRGVGKTTILNRLKNEYVCLEFYDLLIEICKNIKTWDKVEYVISRKIKNLALRNDVIFIALHYAVPYESLFSDIKEKIVRDFSKKYNPSLTKTMIDNMLHKNIEFIFFYINLKNKLLKDRLKMEIANYPKRISNQYLSNLNKIKKEDYLKFKEITSCFKKRKMKIKHFIINNNQHINKTISVIKERTFYEKHE